MKYFMLPAARSPLGTLLPLGLSKRTALRAGYGSVIALLLFSSIEAYQIQNTVSEKHLDIYRRYVQQDTAVSRLRRTLWLAGNYVRDFFINTSVEGAVLLKSQIRDLKKQSDQQVSQLDTLKSIRRRHPELVTMLREFWITLEPIPDTMLHRTSAEQYRFVQAEIEPRRIALYNHLREMTEADLAALQQNEADFSEARKTAARRIVIMLGLCVILALAVSRLSLTYSEGLERESDRQYAEALRARKEQEQLSARLLEIEEDNRKRLSRELHDEIGQTLAVLQIEISNALASADVPGSGVARDRLRRAWELAEKTVQTVRNIALMLRPALLDDLGLVPALQWHLEEFVRRSGMHCDFTEEGVEDALPDSVKTCVYRVVQEALHNCEKHAGAKRIAVRLRQRPGMLTAEIEDDGRGFEVDEKSMPHGGSGLGILGMRERASKIGGVVTLDSAPGRGTRVSLALPLTVPEASAAPTPVCTQAGA